MHTWLVGICDRLQNIRLVVWLVTAQYAYPFIQWTHFTGSLPLARDDAGARFPVARRGEKISDGRPIVGRSVLGNWLGLGIAVLVDFTLFATAAVGYIDNPAFRLKLGVLLPLALTWHIVVQQKSRTWGRDTGNARGGQARGLDGNRAVGVSGRGGGSGFRNY